MNIKRKRIVSFFITFVMILSSFNFILLGNDKVYAEEIASTENIKQDVTINDTVKILVDYFEKTYYTRYGGTVDANTYMVLKKAGVDLSTGNWKKDKKVEDNKAIGTKARQANILIEMGEEPLDLIKAMAEQIESMDAKTRYPINEVNAAMAIDKFNKKFVNKKVIYKVENIVELIKKNQKSDGSFDGTPQNTAAALNFLVKHKDIDGVNKIIEDELKFLHEVQKEDGGLYKKYFFTHLQCESVVGLIGAGENLTDIKWIKDGKTPIEGLFKYWDGKKICKKDGSMDERAYDKVLFALISLKEAGYGDYQLKGIKFDNIIKDEPEKTCKVNITIVYPQSDKKYDIKFKPSEVAISNRKQSGITVFGALQAATDQYEARGIMITSIFGIKNEGMNGWMYSLNGQVPSTYANETEVKDGDKIVWYYSKNGMDEKGPSYEEIVNIINRTGDEEKPDEGTSDSVTVNNAIKALIQYFNEYEYKENEGKLTGLEYAAMVKANADLSKKGWDITEKIDYYSDKIDKKAEQTRVLMDLGKDPRNYNNVDLVQDIADELSKTSGMSISVVQGMIAVDRYNEKFKDKKVNYNEKKLVDTLVSKQKKDTGCILHSIKGTVYSINALSRHKNIEGVQEAIDKALKYLQGNLNNDGGIYNRNYMTLIHTEIITQLVEAGIDLKDKCWVKEKDIISALFNLWNGKYFAKDKEEKDSVSPKNVLYSLAILKEKGYGDYVLKGVKFHNLTEEENPTKPEEPKVEEKIEKSLKDLKDYYSTKSEFEYNEALSFNFSSDNISEDIKIIKEKFKLIPKCKCKYVNDYSENIIEIISIGEDPRNYNSINYVEEILKYQVKEGKDRGKFVMVEGEENWPQIQAWVILALDMAEAKYDKQEAIKALCNMSSNGIYKDVYTTAMVITALAPYKELPEVKNILNTSLKYIKDEQNSQGGYDLNKKIKNDPRTISKVIQALIANGVDPLSDEWCKNKNTMLDALLQNKKGGNFGSDILNSEAFMAIADLYKGESMFSKVRVKNNSPEKKDIKIENLTTNKEFKLDSDAKITIKAINNTKETRNAALIVGLFDKDDKLVNYAAAEQSIEGGKAVNLRVSLKLPKESGYTVKSFIWSGLDNMNPLSNVIEIPVK
ncbi:DUF4430 domain-containing protein [Clostridium lundense]|uniref:DUF4430 domain-containing protein n=1 Tax=Clostridium lundense TaxID=319475 RepID=UPI000483123D|nr:DUF4430 domain-containing protein [Clostridium lundense]